jgi:hypothetical protein
MVILPVNIDYGVTFIAHKHFQNIKSMGQEAQDNFNPSQSYVGIQGVAS